MTAAEIKTVLDRNAKALELRPAIGRNTAVTKARLREGLRCEVEEGPWKLEVDMSVKSGGEGTAPNPGVYGRASLASCLAVGYAMWAARMEVPLRVVEVEVAADFDTRAEYGVEGGKAGYEQIRCVVTVESDAPEEAVRRVIEAANRGSSYLHVWSDPQDVRVEVRVSGRGIGAEAAMEARLQRRIQRYGWDRAAADYEAFWSRQIAPAQEKLLEMAALGEGERVLDVACGTGLVSLAAAGAVGEAGGVRGTDISEAMVAEARQRAAMRGLAQARFERVEAEAELGSGGAFDAGLWWRGLRCKCVQALAIPSPGLVF